MTMLDSNLGCALQPNVSFLGLFEKNCHRHLERGITWEEWNIVCIKCRFFQKQPRPCFCQWFPPTSPTWGCLSRTGSKSGSKLYQTKTLRGRPNVWCCSPVCEVVQHLATDFVVNMRVVLYEVFPWCRKTALFRGIPVCWAWKGTISKLPPGG